MNHFTQDGLRNVGVKKVLIEFLGTFGLTYAACWSVIYADIGMLSRVGYGFSSAFILTTLMYFFIPTTGGQFNPAITIALFCLQKIDLPIMIWFLIAQVIGGLCGAGFIFLEITSLLSNKVKDKSTLGIPLPGKPDYDVSPFWCEFIGTFLLMWVYTSLIVDSKRRQSEGIGASAYGISYFIALVTLGEVSGGSFNPARAFAPAFITGKIGTTLLAQILAPILSAIAAGFSYKLLYMEPGDNEMLVRQESQTLSYNAEGEVLQMRNSQNKLEINPNS